MNNDLISKQLLIDTFNEMLQERIEYYGDRENEEIKLLKKVLEVVETSTI